MKRGLGRVGLGRLAYPMGAVAAGFTRRGWRLRVDLDGVALHDGAEPVLMVAMGMGGTVGGGARLVPGADPHDGLVDVVVSLAVGPLARLGYARQIKDGSHVAAPTSAPAAAGSSR